MPLFQTLGNKVSQGAQNRVETFVALFKSPGGSHAQRVNSLATLYIIGVFVVTLGVLGTISGKGYMALVVLVVGFVAATATVQHRVVPVLYMLLAPRMGWPSWSEGWRMDEAKASGALSEPIPAAPARAQRPDDPADGPGYKILAAWAALDAERRRARALDVLKHLLGTVSDPPTAWSAVMDLPEGPAREEMAVFALSMSANFEGIAVSTPTRPNIKES